MVIFNSYVTNYQRVQMAMGQGPCQVPKRNSSIFGGVSSVKGGISVPENKMEIPMARDDQAPPKSYKL